MDKKDTDPLKKFADILRDARMMDDFFMKKVFEDNKPAVQLVLNILLDREDLIVENFTTSKEYKNIKGHSVCLDVFANDKDGNHYDIEIQRDNKGADPKRARFHASMMDTEMLEKGKDFSCLKKNYVIFIMEEDIFKQGDPIYSVERVFAKTGKPFGDESYILYVNGTYRGNDKLGRLLHDMFATDPKEMFYPELAGRADYLKNKQKGKTNMCKALQDLIIEERREEREESLQEGRQEGLQEGLQKGIKALIEVCQELGQTDEQIIEKVSRKYHLSKVEAAKYVYAV